MMNLPPVTKNLIIINLLFFLAKLVAGRNGLNLDDVLGLHFFMAPDFRIFQFFTYMFMHGNITHILFNMFAVWMFGRVMETYWGARRFLLYYMVCGVGAGLVQESVQYVQYLWQGLGAYETVNVGGSITMSMADYLNNWTTIGASGAVYGILLAFGMTFPDERMFIFPLPMPVRAKFFVLGYAVIELLSAMGNSGDGVAHFAHLGGMLFGFLLILYWRKNGGNGYYGRGDSLFGKMRRWFSDWRNRFSSYSRTHMKVSMGERKDDYAYNARKKAETDEIDRILDKVRKGGYASLSDEEKRKLFDASQR